MRTIYRVNYGALACRDFDNYTDAYNYAFIGNSKRAKMNPTITEIEVMEYRD